MSDIASDSKTPSVQTFTLYGCREVLTFAAGAVMFERQMTLLEECVYQNPALAFDTARALVETTCKTILNDRGEKPDETGNIQTLLRQTIDKLQLLPDSHSGDTRLTSAFKETINSMVNVVVGLGRIRNMGGFVSHGKDAYDGGFQDTLQAQFVARTADTIVHFLYNTHRNYSSPLVRQPPLAYDDNPDFNERVDELHPAVKIFEIPYQISQLLFYTDEDVYREQLGLFQSDLAELAEDEES